MATPNERMDEIVELLQQIDKMENYAFGLSCSLTLHAKAGTNWHHAGGGINERLAKALLPEVGPALARIRSAMLGELLGVEATAERALAQVRQRRAEVVKFFRLGVK